MPLKLKVEACLAFLACTLLRSTFQPYLAKSFEHALESIPELRQLICQTVPGFLNRFFCAFLSFVNSLFNGFVGLGNASVGLFNRLRYPVLDLDLALDDSLGSASL